VRPEASTSPARAGRMERLAAADRRRLSVRRHRVAAQDFVPQGDRGVRRRMADDPGCGRRLDTTVLADKKWLASEQRFFRIVDEHEDGSPQTRTRTGDAALVLTLAPTSLCDFHRPRGNPLPPERRRAASLCGPPAA